MISKCLFKLCTAQLIRYHEWSTYIILCYLINTFSSRHSDQDILWTKFDKIVPICKNQKGLFYSPKHHICSIKSDIYHIIIIMRLYQSYVYMKLLLFKGLVALLFTPMLQFWSLHHPIMLQILFPLYHLLHNSYQHQYFFQKWKKSKLLLHTSTNYFISSLFSLSFTTIFALSTIITKTIDFYFTDGMFLTTFHH